MLHKFYKYNTENNLFTASDKLLVAVSGGVDSVVLCHLLHKEAYNFSIAHVNFGLRGKESDEDEAFVRTLAASMGVEFLITRFDTAAFAEKEKMSIQMAARKLRYDWFDSLKTEYSYRYLLTAHHLNDTLETSLFNWTKGTGISGLRGMLSKAGTIVRPLLFATKDEIITFAKAENLRWREDSSNESIKYHRNRLRKEVIPVLKTINPSLEDTFLHTSERLRATELIYERYVEDCKMKIFSQNESSYILSIEALKEVEAPLQILYEIIHPFGFNYVQAKTIWDAVDSQPGLQFYTNEFVLVKDRLSYIVSPLPTNVVDKEMVLTNEQESIFIQSLQKKITIGRSVGYEVGADTNKAFINARKLFFPLQIRKWQTGDSFSPLGMRGKKNISDFLTDLKLPFTEKENVHVLLSKGEIVWVIGYRLDDKYKAETGEESVVISLESKD